MFKFVDDLPGTRRTPTFWPEFAKQAKEHPGMWAVVGEYAYKGNASRRATELAYRPPAPLQPKGHFEFAARESKVFARFIAEEPWFDDVR